MRLGTNLPNQWRCSIPSSFLSSTEPLVHPKSRNSFRPCGNRQRCALYIRWLHTLICSRTNERRRAARHKDIHVRELSFRDILTVRDIIVAQHDKNRAELWSAVIERICITRSAELSTRNDGSGYHQTHVELIPPDQRLIFVKTVPHWQRPLPFGEDQSLQDALRKDFKHRHCSKTQIPGTTSARPGST